AVGVPALVVILLGFLDPPVLGDLRNIVFDGYQRLAPRAWTPESPVRIVDIDDESLARVGQWPWPRSTIAQIVDRLRQDGAAAIAFDIVFAEPDAASAEAIIRRLPTTPGRTLLEQELGQAKSNDARLAEALAGAPSILGAVLSHQG